MGVLPELLETIQDGVATPTFNRPERLNALSTPIMEGLLHGLPRLAGDQAVKVVVLTGAGRSFCAGGDVKDMAQGGERRSAAEATAYLRSRMEVSAFCTSCRSRRLRWSTVRQPGPASPLPSAGICGSPVLRQGW